MRGADSFTNANGEYVVDLRTGGSQQFERSVKEFGAVCDGVTDDTNGVAGGDQLCAYAQCGVEDSAGDVQDTCAELAW